MTGTQATSITGYRELCHDKHEYAGYSKLPFISPGLYLGVVFLGQMIVLILVFGRIPILILIVAVYLTFPSAV